MYKQAIVMLIIANATALAIHFSGYDIVETLISVIIADLAAAWIFVEDRRRTGYCSLERLRSVESACSRISERVQREDITSMLRTVSEKNLALERKLSGFSQSLMRSCDDGILEN
jgi:hypothetical protein